MDSLGDSLKKVLLAGIGAVATTAEKSKDVLDDLVKKGELTVEQGKVLNEELKHNIKEKMKDNITVPGEKADLSQEELAEKINDLSEEDKKEILKSLKAKKNA